MNDDQPSGTPDNLVKLHQGEEGLRIESLRLTARCADSCHHIMMIERAMDLIHELLGATNAEDKDELAVKVLGIRIFNTLAVTLKLCLSGYYQAAAAQLRDALETAFLLDYFTMDRSMIAAWRTLRDRDREKRFKPVAVREALDERDRLTARKRGEAYKRFCRLASHPNPDSVTMLVPQGSGNAHCGPFLDEAGLKAMLAETALTAVQAVQMFRLLIKAKSIKQLRAKLDFMECEAEWAKKFFRQSRNRGALAEIRELLATAEARAAN